MNGDVDVAITEWLQWAVPASLRPILDLASLLGGTLGLVILAALAFWWSGSRLGVRVALVSSASALLNVHLKWLFHQPRPYFLFDRITTLQAPDGFGMPSGHAQGTVAAWGSILRWSGWRRALTLAGALATLLAGVARVYYGVHSVAQVLCGWLAGLAVVATAAAIERPLARWWARASPAARWPLAIAPPLGILAAGLLLRAWLVAGWEAPAEWVARHRQAVARLDPSQVAAELRLFDAGALARWAGGLLGAALVAAWYGSRAERAFVATSPRRSAIDTVVGLAAMAAVLYAGELLIRQTGELGELPRFAILYWVIGVVVPRLGARIDAALSRR